MEVTIAPINEQEVIDKIYTACRTCYAAGTPNDMWDEVSHGDHNIETTEKKLKLIKHVLDSGHWSTIEHVQLTYFISGVSRSLTHQLVRHRLCSYSQQSQRYVEFKDGRFDFIMPPSIASNQDCRDFFYDVMDHITEAYNFFIQNGIKPEDARSVLPNACSTNITVSTNARNLINIVGLRTCTLAQLEIRQLFKEIAKKTGEQLPFLKPYLVPKCELLGYCNEGKRCCGRKLTKEVVLGSMQVTN